MCNISPTVINNTKLNIIIGSHAEEEKVLLIALWKGCSSADYQVNLTESSSRCEAANVLHLWCVFAGFISVEVTLRALLVTR